MSESTWKHYHHIMWQSYYFNHQRPKHTGAIQSESLLPFGSCGEYGSQDVT